MHIGGTACSNQQLCEARRGDAFRRDRPFAPYFLISIDYFVPGYSDPESSEYFADTSWTAQITDLTNSTFGGIAGNGSETGNAVIDLGVSSQPGVTNYTLSFTALNTFSGATDTLYLEVFSAAGDSAGQVLVGGDGLDILAGGIGNDVLRGNGNNDIIDAGDGADILEGGDGADQLRGGAGDDVMAGGAGNDTYLVGSVLT